MAERAIVGALRKASQVDLAARGAVVGRMAELAELDRLVAEVTAGRGGICWLQGEPGVGKSALTEVVLARAQALGCATFRGAAEALMEAFPLRLMADCLGISASSRDEASVQIAALLRGEPAGSGAVDPVLAASERMLELVDRRCARGPVALVVEDLHWADRPSLLLWNRLARATDQIPLLLVGTTRPVPRQAEVDQLRELVIKRDGVVLDLAPLASESAAELAGRIAGGAPGPGLREAAGRAGGNPLYVRELVDALVRDDLVIVSGGAAELRGDVTVAPASLNVAIGSRLGFLEPDARRVLRMAALLGNEFDAAELAVVTARSVMVLTDVLADAVAGGVISDAGGRFRFRHELVHQVLLDETPSAIRGALHGEIARGLALAGGGVDAVARHLLAVPGRIDDWALDWLAAVPESALYGLPQVCADLLGRAVESAGEDDRRWEMLATRLAQVLFWLGRDERAAQVAAGVARRTSDVILAVRMRIQLIRSAGRMGRFEDALLVTLRPADAEGLPLAWRARLGAWSAMLLHDAGSAGQGAAMALDALDQAVASADPLSIAAARHAAAMCCGAQTRPAHLKAALAALSGQDPESMDLRMLVLSNYAHQSEDLGQLAEAEGALAEALPLADRIGTVRAARILGSAVGFCYRTGRWDEALVHLASIDPEFSGADGVNQIHALGAIIALRRGDRDTADAHLRAASNGDPTKLAPVRFYPVAEALAMRAEADGDLPRAAELMSSRLSEPGTDGHRDDMPYLVRLALATGDAATAASAAAAAAVDLAADGSPSRVVAAAFCRALIDDDADGLLAVGGEYRQYGWLPYGASAFEEAAASLAAAGDAARARAAQTEAVRIYAGLGAAWDIRRADARLRAQGVRRGPRSIHRRASTGWEALTPSEERIARLVAQGLSNPDIASELFLSRRTVQAHVSSILAKLGVRSRIDIVRAAQVYGAGGATATTSRRGR